MRDGSFTVYVVQHRYHGRTGRWTDSALDEMLFGALPWRDRKGEKGDAYRRLIGPTHECWQATGTHAFLREDDAWAARDAVAVERPNHRLRVARRTWAQITVPTRRPAVVA